MYKLHFSDSAIEGVFVKDNDFGSFFLTLYTDIDLPYNGIHSLKVMDDDIYVSINEEINYRVYSLKKDNKYACVYIYMVLLKTRTE